MTRPGTGSILWYVHDHGSGHLSRARQVTPLLDSPVVVAVGPGQSAEARRCLPGPVVALPTDVPDHPGPTTGPFHHAPAGATVRRRALALAEVVERFGCTTAVVDVSVEVTVLARLLGLRVITVRQSGRRDDAAHILGLATADAVWVPQHPVLEPHLPPVDDRWRFTGAFSRFDGDCRAGPTSDTGGEGRPCGHGVLLAVGEGGHSLDLERWRAGRLPTGIDVTIVGANHRWEADRARSVGRIDDIAGAVRAADVVIASAGWGIVADAAALGARLVLVPERRPFDEQLTRAEALAEAGLAIHRAHWPTPDEVPEVIAAAATLRPGRWRKFYDGGGARRSAALVEAVHRT